jgi:prevent-host-death family protein
MFSEHDRIVLTAPLPQVQLISSTIAHVATSGYICDMEIGIRELKDNLSRYIRRTEAGERISVTAHGRVIAELVPPGRGAATSPGSRWDELIAAGILHPPVEAGDPFEDWPDIRLPRGTAAELIDTDRGEA